ncbi:PREDICTED: AT-hook motif nuclear-localized protein 28-like [Camelina sativa]|uniref:AT-hook motif nuclear-localized protein n=1 Tax=Camelina sativa TaxID=90675 RepID=A0ABM0WUU5_CAMSA|nr:PREDICTED: AT-hook motif nuclear-localized protein 28-like [Camelina sativa]
MLSKVPQKQHLQLSPSSSSMEMVRCSRGRPRGSKNKPKAPIFVTSEPPMSPYILQVPSGVDVVEAINRFCRQKGIGFCVLSGSGSVTDVTLRQPSPAAPGSTITFHGKFDLLSISATFFPPSTSLSPPPVSNFFTVSLAGPQGQVIGGFVAGPLVSAGTFYVVAASFSNPSYHRIPAAEEELENNAVSGEGEGQSPPVSGQVAEGSGGESMYSCQMGGSDVHAKAPPPY